MTVIKPFTLLFYKAYLFVRHGLLMIATFLKVIRHLRLLNRQSSSPKPDNKNWQSGIETIKPLLFKLGQISSPRPDLLEKKISDVLTQAKSKIKPMDDNKQELIIEPLTKQPEIRLPISHSVSPEQHPPPITEQLGQKIKSLLIEIDLAQFTGDKLAHQINTLLDKGLGFKNQISESIQFNFAQHLHEELQGFTSQKLFNDFIQDLDGLSLHIERLEARIQQLMSCHEIN
ncbi:TPA: hypothetical protein JA361_01525 [Legionella pneumophila]|nr:hypothetical protein [Legionella pneumophila]HAT8182823.1 hypothetical protein [Legionella pneumophila]